MSVNVQLTDVQQVEQEIEGLKQVADADGMPKEDILRRLQDILARCDNDSGTQMYAAMVAYFTSYLVSLAGADGLEMIQSHFSRSAFGVFQSLWSDLMNCPGFGV